MDGLLDLLRAVLEMSAVVFGALDREHGLLSPLAVRGASGAGDLRRFDGVPVLRADGSFFGILGGLQSQPARAPGAERAFMEVLARLLAFQVEQDERARAERQDARLDGALLMARTAEHELNNQLARTVGYADLLARDPRLPEELRSFALEALEGARLAAATVERLHRVTRLQEHTWGDRGDTVIDLDRSTGDGRSD